MLTNRKLLQAFFLLLSLLWSAGAAAQRRLVLIDQDSSGPAHSNTMSMMVLLQSPQAEVLGITVVTGNEWRDVEVKRALRLLELIGRSEVPVVPGAVFPLVRTEEETRLGMQLIGKPSWLGAFVYFIKSSVSLSCKDVASYVVFKYPLSRTYPPTSADRVDRIAPNQTIARGNCFKRATYRLPEARIVSPSEINSRRSRRS